MVHSFVLANDSITYPVFFKFNSYELDTNETNSLRFFFEMFTQYNIDSIKVDGFCDDVGSIKYNLDLSKNIYNVSQKKYEQGVGSNLEVINAQTSLKESEMQYNK